MTAAATPKVRSCRDAGAAPLAARHPGARGRFRSAHSVTMFSALRGRWPSVTRRSDRSQAAAECLVPRGERPQRRAREIPSCLPRAVQRGPRSRPYRPPPGPRDDSFALAAQAQPEHTTFAPAGAGRGEAGMHQQHRASPAGPSGIAVLRRTLTRSLPLLVAALLALGAAGAAPAAAQEVEPPVCRADLVVVFGMPCVYPGTDSRFLVDRSGRGRFLFFRDAVSVEVPGWRIDGRVYHLRAQSQGDGSWLIESVGEPPGVPAAPEPSPDAFAWTVTRDVAALGNDHGTPTGMWGDGAVLWLLDNATGRPDALHGYPLDAGPDYARDGGRPEAAPAIAVAEDNAVARGVWSDGAVLWVSDSGADRVFAYDAAGGRLEGREFALDAGNAEARGVWGDGAALWVLDAGEGALFAYELPGGEPLGRHELDAANAAPHGLWSDGTGVWVSDHDRARLFAYRMPAEPGGATELRRTPELDFAALAEAGNGSPRGVWSDGRVMYVADAGDDRVYSYQMPADAPLAALSLSGLDIGRFKPDTRAYRAEWGAPVRETTVEARARDAGATVTVEPADADGDPANGHQVDLFPAAPDDDFAAIVVTVTAADGRRSPSYRVKLPNRGPRGDAVEPLRLFSGGPAAELDLRQHFSDPDGDPLGFELGEPQPSDVIGVALAGGTVTVTPLAEGDATFSVAATDGEQATPPVTVTVSVAVPTELVLRPAARRLDGGRVELALQQLGPGGAWGELLLPRTRTVPGAAAAGGWQHSSHLTLELGGNAVHVRLIARSGAGGRTELALQTWEVPGAWGGPRLPRSRFLPADAPAGLWLFGSPLTIEP
ncbi:MAG: hypothetical protein F4017_07875 [Acidimicrobiaceae bacterium]|nr:hypothetical protein [Acidimicrobiaceae bacterium]MYK74490.1 hypothetical protein [Acidimicrobiaceae bacterium]